jgi:MFS family permease
MASRKRRNASPPRLTLPPIPPGTLTLRTDVHSWFEAGAKALVTTYRRQTWLGVTLMAAQAFCYNAVFFTYALILTRFYNVPSGNVGLFILPFAIGNFLGPLVLGRLFDTIGRRIMITATYGISGVLMVLTGWLFAMGWLDAIQQTLAWTAYLTVGESFPLEVRAIAIALFYAFGTGVGGVAGPALFGVLIDTGSRVSIFYGYLLGGVLMVIAAIVAGFLAANAERRSLEDVAPPLSAV